MPGVFLLVFSPPVRTCSSPHIAPSFIMPAMAALGLTGMESRVAVLLAEGMNVTEVVAATGRSPGADGASRRELAPALP